jgi:hypothetical protein
VDIARFSGIGSGFVVVLNKAMGSVFSSMAFQLDLAASSAADQDFPVQQFLEKCNVNHFDGKGCHRN